jgi:hypothetical protein
MTVVKTGYQQDYQGSWIDKDPAAKLVYSMDWITEWLSTGSTLVSANYTISTVAGDPSPLTRVSQGIQANVSYVELSGGTDGEIYTVTCTVTTSDSEIDARRFRVKVKARYL